MTSLPEDGPAILDYYGPGCLSTAFYDLVAALDPCLEGDLDFYKALVAPGSWVLELGCGTGRIGLSLAQDDRAVVGLDNAPAMLAQAEAKRARLPPEVVARTAFVQGDMTGFELNHRFEAVIAPFFGFSHLPPGEPRRRAFACIDRHLAPGGVAALHTVYPSGLAGRSENTPESAVLDVAFGPEGRRLQLFVRRETFDAESGRLEQVLDYVVVAPDGTELRRSRERFDYHLSNLEEDAAGTKLRLERCVSPFNAIGEMWVFRKGV